MSRYLAAALLLLQLASNAFAQTAPVINEPEFTAPELSSSQTSSPSQSKPSTNAPSRTAPRATRPAPRPSEPRLIQASLDRPKGPLSQAWRLCVGSGNAQLGLRAAWQRHLDIVRREIGFQYVRFHGVLSDHMGVYTEEQGKPVYNFTYVDELYDAILARGMKPFVEFSFMPGALTTGTKTIFWWKGRSDPPVSYDKWHDVIREFTNHITERYGRDEVRTWFFEIWNEPNLSGFWTGGLDGYLQLYEAAAKAVHSVDPQYRVGGPATAGPAWIPELIEFATSRSLPLNFISTHTYAIHSIRDRDGKQTGKKAAVADPGSIIDHVQFARDAIAASSKPNLELHFTEWSITPSSRDIRHDSFRSAPFILAKLKRTEGIVESMSYWTFSDIFEEKGVPPGAFHGGFGLINAQGVRKASFFAYKYLNNLLPTELATDDPDSWVTRDDRGNVSALLWNYQPAIEKEGGEPAIYRANHPPAPEEATTATLRLTGLSPGQYQLTIHGVGHGLNDPYTAWQAMGSPPYPSPQQIEQLHALTTDKPLLQESVVIPQTGTFETPLPLPSNSCRLLKLERVTP